MNEFVSWCRHLLVSFLFHVHPYIPLHFIEMIFPLVPLIFHSLFFGAKPRDVLFAPRARRFIHAHAHAENLHVHAHVNGVVQRQPWKSPTIYHRNLRRKKNERSVSVHTSVDCGDVW